MRTAVTLLLAALLAAPAAAQEGKWSALKRGAEEVGIYRDEWGIPHVFAPSVEAAWCGQGYAEAQDRWGQMDRNRLAATGGAAEFLGKDALGGDVERRRHGYTEEELRRFYEEAGDRFRIAARAYAEGVNAWVGEKGIETKPWEVTDTVAIVVMMSRMFGQSGGWEPASQKTFETLVERFGEKKGREIFNDVWFLDDPAAPATLFDHRRGPRPAEGKHGFRPVPPLGDEWYAKWRRETEWMYASQERLGIPTYFGSNAWAVGAGKSESGNAILYGGPMMGFATPAIYLESHVSAPGLNAAGMSFPGAPGIMIGFNENVAWTVTSGLGDLVDVRVLELNPENSEQYRHDGKWRNLEKIPARIKVKDAEPHDLTVYRSHYGPLLGERDLKNLRAYTAHVSFWEREVSTFESVLNFNFAADLAELQKEVRGITTSYNVLAADSKGRIGWWFAGLHPIRKKEHDPRMVQPGDGSMEWEGFVPFEQWPQSVDPPRGFLANWNNKPAREWQRVGAGKVFRGIWIFCELEHTGKVDLEKIWNISRGTAEDAWVARHFLRHMMPLIEDKGLRRWLLEWDLKKKLGGFGHNLSRRWVDRMVERIFGEKLKGDLGRDRDVQNSLLCLLEGESSWRRLEHDWLEGRDLQELGREAMGECLKKGLKDLRYEHPAIDFGWRIGKVPMARGHATYQMAVELTKEGPKAVTIAAPGQSESHESPHFRDQIPLFRKWGHKSFVFRREEMK